MLKEGDEGKELRGRCDAGLEHRGIPELRIIPHIIAFYSELER